MSKQRDFSSTVVEEKDITEIVSVITGVPVEELGKNEAQKLLNLEKRLDKKVIGQPEALKQVSAMLRRNRVGLRNPNKPIGSFIFLGTSGVGKTLVAETLAGELFDNPENIIRLDMSEFSEQHTVSRLVGAPPGYVGYEEGGELTERLRHKPYSVILLDEIEKAHPEVFNILLQVLDNGQLVDGKGRTTNFRNSLIIMTSNIGSHLIRKEGDIGFIRRGESKKDQKAHYKNISEKLTEELRRGFRVEFLNRIDSVIVFKPLTKQVGKRIAKLLIKEVADRLKTEHDMKLEVDNKVYDFLMEKGFSDEFGAREMHRSISETIEDQLSEAILSGVFKKGQTVKATIKKNQVVLR
jgi:ATP-dependent Clp protease ATP-binding subunit ClpC